MKNASLGWVRDCADPRACRIQTSKTPIKKAPHQHEILLEREDINRLFKVDSRYGFVSILIWIELPGSETLFNDPSLQGHKIVTCNSVLVLLKLCMLPAQILRSVLELSMSFNAYDNRRTAN